MKRLALKQILEACKMSFDGMTYAEIAKKLEVNPNTISRWRKLMLWKEMERKLIEAEIEKVLKVDEKNDK